MIMGHCFRLVCVCGDKTQAVVSLCPREEFKKVLVGGAAHLLFAMGVSGSDDF